MTVNGFGGALLAAVAISIVGFLLALVLLGGLAALGGASP
jgi:hypothetical protein